MMGSLITLITDFGVSDAYVPSVKGAILQVNPQATIIDITHDIQAQDILEGAFVLGSAYRYFPRGTIHVAVVDPGVGTRRRGILLVTPGAFFVGPDNGIFSYVLADLAPGGRQSRARGAEPYKRRLPKGIKAYHLNNPHWWRQRVSRTFHGRDVFAPVAAHLSLGVKPEEMGDETSFIEVFHIPRAVLLKNDTIEGCVLHVDRFGNLITSIQEKDMVSARVDVKIGGKRIAALSSSYAEGEGLLAIINSGGYLEVALKNGNAQQALGAKVGDPVIVLRKGN